MMVVAAAMTVVVVMGTNGKRGEEEEVAILGQGGCQRVVLRFLRIGVLCWLNLAETIIVKRTLGKQKEREQAIIHAHTHMGTRKRRCSLQSWRIRSGFSKRSLWMWPIACALWLQKYKMMWSVKRCVVCVVCCLLYVCVCVCSRNDAFGCGQSPARYGCRNIKR